MAKADGSYWVGIKCGCLGCLESKDQGATSNIGATMGATMGATALYSDRINTVFQ